MSPVGPNRRFTHVRYSAAYGVDRTSTGCRSIGAADPSRSSVREIDHSVGRHKSSPAIDFANEGINQIRAIDSRKIVAHRKPAGCKTIRQEAIARAIRFHCFRINLDNLSWNGRGDLVAQIDRIETGKAPHALASYRAKQQSCMTGYHHLDPLQGERDVDDGAELRDRAVACQRDKNRPEPMTCL